VLSSLALPIQRAAVQRVQSCDSGRAPLLAIYSCVSFQHSRGLRITPWWDTAHNHASVAHAQHRRLPACRRGVRLGPVPAWIDTERSLPQCFFLAWGFSWFVVARLHGPVLSRTLSACCGERGEDPFTCAQSELRKTHPTESSPSLL